jgi:DeoR family transcriptional regulator, suf operon transcriptional repressor
MAMTTEPEAALVRAGHSSTKRKLLLLLKESPGAPLQEIAAALGISKVAALRHLTRLESDGVVERSYRSGGVGRPRVHFRLARPAARLFPQAYDEVSRFALAYVERKLGRGSVVDLLHERADDLVVQQGAAFHAQSLGERVDHLARLRSEGGYMAELGGCRRGTFELRELNCPILAVAERYPEACEVERRMFERLLGATVETQHRVVAGDPVCRFLIRSRSSTDPGGAFPGPRRPSAAVRAQDSR